MAHSAVNKLNPPGKHRGEERRCEPFGACIEAALARYLKDLNGHRPQGLYKMVMQEVERPFLEMVMRHARSNQSQAAVLLGINRNTLRKKLKIHGIE
ncbi:MAG TPA: Fis family transcriptional regulator [Acidiferrobacteraceae bacterium]|nr:Fis family transcriptional regulator [Acidiferrobacteraceae bacterium]